MGETARPYNKVSSLWRWSCVKTWLVDNPTSELLLQRPGINPNQWTVSIEREGFATEHFTQAQYATKNREVPA